MMKTICAWTAMAALLMGCGGGGGSSNTAETTLPEDTTPVAVLSAGEVALATRLADSHLDNGAFDWRQNTFPYDTTVAGFQNVTGLTALGLAEAWFAAPSELPAEIEGELAETGAHLLGVMSDFLADTVTSVSFPNFMFMRILRDNGLVSDADWPTVQSAFTKLMFDRDATDGTVAGIVSDGVFNRVLDGRTGQGLADLAGWDLCFIYKALLAMEWPQAELDWVFDALVALDFHFGETYEIISAAHIAEICALHGDAAACGVRVIQVQSAFVVETEGTSVGTDHQTTAYAVMGLAAAGEDVSALQTWLASQIGADGELVLSDGYEYFEIMGEVLQALRR